LATLSDLESLWQKKQGHGLKAGDVNFRSVILS
jgi:hypothetical protein